MFYRQITLATLNIEPTVNSLLPQIKQSNTFTNFALQQKIKSQTLLHINLYKYMTFVAHYCCVYINSLSYAPVKRRYN